MLTKWGLTNFKSIYHADIDLAPLTVLTGTNNSGKSALLQSMLLVAQTMREPQPEAPASLTLKGKLVNLGRFDEILSFNSKVNNGGSPKLGIRWTYCEHEPSAQPDSTPEKDFYDDCLLVDREIDPVKPVRINEFKEKIQFDTVFSPGGLVNIKEEITRHNSSTAVEEKIALDAHEIEQGYKKLYGGYTESMGDTKLHRFEDIIISLEKNFIPYKLLDERFRTFIDPEDNEKTDEDILLSGLSEEKLQPINEKTEKYFSKQFKYLGALRERKLLHNNPESSDKTDVGVGGEYIASVLRLNKDHVRYIHPENFSGNSFFAESAVLSNALSSWLIYFGIADEIKIEDTKKYGMELKVPVDKDEKFYVDITQVGTGVSQILPILVMCLLAEEGSTIIIEEPESHFHPRVQSRLADFFLSMALLGKQCIIETHSEYFIKRLRLRIAQAPFGNNDIHDAVKIFFATKEGKETAFEEVQISEYGSKDEWPEDFFDESINSSIEILNAVRGKIKESGKNDSLWGDTPYDGYGDSNEEEKP
jgi:predicted ATPase